MNEQQVRHALHRIAEAGNVPDEAAAWERITAGIRAEQRATGRRRWYLGVGGLALSGAAAAAFVVLAGNDHDREAVDVRPRATDPVTPTTTETTTETIAPMSTTLTEPGDLAIVTATATGEYSGIRVYDGDGSGFTAAVGPTAFSYADPSITADGTLWFTEESGDTSAVTRVEWTSTDRETPFGDETRSPAVSPDGSTIAYVHDGVTVERPSIRFVDLATGEQTRELFWADDDEDFFHTNGSMAGLEWSPDGTRLLFVSSYEGSEVLAVDPAAASLSEATRLVDADAFVAHWLGVDQVVVIDRCCYPDHENNEVRRYDLPSGTFEVLDIGPNTALDVDGRPDGSIAVLDDDGFMTVSAYPGGGQGWSVGPAYDIGW